MPEHSPSHYSSGLEKVLEHRFIAELTAALWLEGCRDFEVLRSEVDASGYDLVVEAKGILRHIQLKSMVKGGKKQHVTVNTRLASKKAGCLVWFDYDPKTLELGPFRWFGTLPGLGLPDPGDKIAKHSKADATGTKNPRTGHRLLRKSKLIELRTVADLVPLLFGFDGTDETELLRSCLCRSHEPGWEAWLQVVHSGRFEAISRNLRWVNSVRLAHLIDGYGLAAKLGAGDPFEFEGKLLQHALDVGKWMGGPAVLWTTLFLEHRRWRTAPVDPDPEMQRLLDVLCLQLVQSLTQPGETPT